MRTLLGAYERFLASNKRGDAATVYEEAMNHLDWCPIQPQDCWTELPDVVWSPLQRQLIDAMPGERVDTQAVEVEGITRPRRLVARHDGPQRHAAKAPPLQAETIDLFHAGGREAEIEEVFRRILKSGLPLDEIEIACASSEHASLAWEKALRHEWPVTIGPGIPVTLTRPGRALLALCEWIESDFHASTLRRLFQSGDVRFPTDDVTPGQAARLLVKAEAAWGRATYDLSLSHLARSYRAAASNKDLTDDVREGAAAKAARTEALRAWIADLLSRVPTEDAGQTVALQDCVSVATHVPDRAARQRQARSTLRLARGCSTKFRSSARSGDFRCRLADRAPFHPRAGRGPDRRWRSPAPGTPSHLDARAVRLRRPPTPIRRRARGRPRVSRRRRRPGAARPGTRGHSPRAAAVERPRGRSSVGRRCRALRRMPVRSS